MLHEFWLFLGGLFLGAHGSHHSFTFHVEDGGSSYPPKP